MHFGVHRYYAGCIILSLQSYASPMMKSLIGSGVMKAGIAGGFSSRDRFGLLAGVGWGLCLGYFFKSGDLTGPWLVILLGPPVILLISPTRPILSWQVPIVTAIAFGTILWRSRDETAGDLLEAGLLTWLICTLFSSPWALIFQRRIERLSKGTHQKRGGLVSYTGVALLVFAACALTIVGFILIFYSAPSIEPSGRSAPLYGLIMVTCGTGFSIGSYRFGRTLGVSKPVRQVLDAVMGLCSVVVIISLIISFYFILQQSNASKQFGASEICSGLAVLETVATTIWLTRAGGLEKSNARKY